MSLYRSRGRRRRGQVTVEVVILLALVGLSIAWVAATLPQAVTSHYVETQKVVTSPL